ncbi:MAG: TIGR02757 family protein [Phycisphaerae bacterium]|nr:TIGR02757 family protein [Phycisphaerae bacterium]
MSDSVKQLKAILEGLYRKYNHHRLIAPDPLQFVYRYKRRDDMEIAGFLASALAYGRVEQIEKSVDRLLGRLGDSPADFTRGFDRRSRNKIGDFKHRFNTAADLGDLLEILGMILNEYGSIENFFVQGYSDSDKNIIPALTLFCEKIMGMHRKKHKGREGSGFGYLIANPDKGSACKRLNLFLRWMVRDDDVDSGLWKSVDKAKLVVPVDVHMGRLCRILKLYDKKTVGLSAALQITESFAKIVPDDPIKYDFALSRIGIVEDCTGKRRKECELCELFGYCAKE